MNLQDLTNLIHLRRYLHDVQNGYASISKDNLRGINAKLRELDEVIVKGALSVSLANLTNTTTVTSSDADFQNTLKIVLDARKDLAKLVNKDGVLISEPPSEENISETEKLPSNDET